jgi:hypothetical protein
MVQDSETIGGDHGYLCNHGYIWEFFKDRVETEFVPRNSDYISWCKLRDLVNATNENLRQYVKAYSELMF